ncbi:sensor histidine kinase [Leucobacter sp. G161]|uniref:sensor histidine kinase n=1 Tax=Leucobacter sp. G161 TaxID=663704 RepID=UPI001379AF7E|nr:histidine kinase [Leucobacter sp. G161]
MSAHSNAPAPFAGVNATWNYTLGSIVALYVLLDLLIISDLLSRFADTRSKTMLVLVLLSVAAAATRIRYCWFLRSDSGSGLPHIGWTIALFAPAVISWATAFVVSEGAFFAAVQLWFSGVLFALVASKRLRWWIIFASLALMLVPLVLSGWFGEARGETERSAATVLIAVYSAALPLMLISSLWFWRVVARLDEARHLAAELAVTQERLRFAADLHDIQGHHLQVIALKAELVERTLAMKPEYAAGQAGEIRLIAKEAMEETRTLVSGLRDVELRNELENASEVLTLSGAACTLEIAAMPSSLEARRTLAFVVREATTNILRHSEATRASIVLAAVRGGVTLTVTNNGVGEAAALHARPAGSGVAGLRARLAEVGGTLATELGEQDEAGAATFTLTVWVPESVGDGEGGAQ